MTLLTEGQLRALKKLGETGEIKIWPYPPGVQALCVQMLAGMGFCTYRWLARGSAVWTVTPAGRTALDEATRSDEQR